MDLAASQAIAASTAERDGRPALQTTDPLAADAPVEPAGPPAQRPRGARLDRHRKRIDVVRKRTRDCECNPSGVLLDRLSVG